MSLRQGFSFCAAERNSMTYRNFRKKLLESLKASFPEGYQIDTTSITKNNGTQLEAVTVRAEGGILSPCIYLKEYYRLYLLGMDMKEITDQIRELCRHYVPRNIRLEDVIDPEKARNGLVCRLVNTSMNQELLKDCPSIPYLNLSILFYILLDDPLLGPGAVIVKNDDLETWQLSEEELFPLAADNIRRLLPADFLPMDRLLTELRGETDCCAEEGGEGGREGAGEGAGELPLYVLTNSRRTYGAVWMADPGTLRCISDVLQGDYWILPSSVHECMILPVSFRDDRESLAQMVSEINRSALAQEEVLADSVYLFRRETGKLEIAA